MSPTARGLTDSTKMARLKPATQGVARPNEREFLAGDLENTNNGTAGGGKEEPPHQRGRKRTRDGQG